MMLAALSTIVLAQAARDPPQVLAQAEAPRPAAVAAAAPPPSTEAVLCENIRLWHRDIVFQMALSLAVGVPPADQPRQTAVQALSQAQQALLDRVQEVYEASCRQGAEPTP